MLQNVCLSAMARESIHDIASDLEAATNTLADLLHLASHELINDGTRAISLLSAAERYTADLKQINQRLYESQRER